MDEKKLEDRIKDFLKTKLPQAEKLTVTDLVRMTEGFSYETMSFHANWFEGGEGVSRDFVLRMEPKAGPVPPYDVEPQYRALKALEDTPVPAPRVYWLEKVKSPLVLPPPPPVRNRCRVSKATRRLWLPRTLLTWALKVPIR